ncbi:SusC/RagA family TonB-linked outer membrane protein [Chitinophaga horti]|uniref:SusC/RagA family TonB-linked outer membrane protein n=1 Tax=Chitinophaga horti TaxID=2920382 RepID=A0ABY6IXK2_9BACT|nr:SusC/RagA family TonB-linked outer membrane protein [Chitinophaga horti]UYQ92115.1 SusC/RagA family TonB-linked outer membrane protein [Chitinophaga horti]
MAEFNAGCVKGGIALALLLQLGTYTTAQAHDYVPAEFFWQKDVAMNFKQGPPLRNVLADMEQRYKVKINYVGNTVNGISAKAPAAKAASVKLIDYLNKFLEPLGLEAEQAASDHYIIYKKEKTSTATPANNPQRANDISPVGANAPTAISAPDHVVQQVKVFNVSGTVTDASGSAIPGASVFIKGTSTGMTTNNEGKYMLSNVRENAIVVFRMIGYKQQEFTITASRVINVKLENDIQSMKDVVITGYQKIDKNNYTGSAITITGEELKRFNSQNILQSIQSFDPSFKLLENNLAGSNPNQLPNINMRGSTALPTGTGVELSRNQMATVTNMPMFMLDGYQVGIQTIWDLDINRIASVTMLKDAAATAVYGSRASNGVLVFITKAPPEGELQVFYNYEMNLNTPDLTQYKVLNAKDKLEYEKLAGLYTENGVDNSDDLQARYYAKYKNVLAGVNTYWLAQPISNDLGHKHSLSVQGGSKTIRYGVDARYQTNKGVMQGSGRERYSLGTQLSYNLDQNRVMFRNSFTISQVKGTESPYGSFSNFVNANPYYPMRDSLGRLIREVDKWNFRDASNGNAAATSTTLNPLWEGQTGNFHNIEYLEFIDNFSAEYNINTSLKLMGNISLTKRTTETNKFASPMSNQFFNDPLDRILDRGQYNFEALNETQVDGNLTLNYNKQVAKHAFNVAVGTSMQMRKNDFKSVEAIGFTNDRFTSINFARRYAEKSPGGNRSEERLAGWFGTINYSYENRFLMDATIRTDGSSKFGSESRMATFWSYGMGWNLHNEAFLRNTFVSQFKLRATTGLTGDVNFPAYLSNTTYSYYSGDWYSTGVGAVFTAFGNNALKWQRTNNYDLGAEIGLFKDRVYFSPRYYYKHTKDLLADVNTPPSTGFGSYKENMGEMVNEGWEANLRANVIRRKNFSVNLNANFTHNRNEITKISDALKAYNEDVDKQQNEKDELKSIPLLRYKEGESVYTYYAVRSLGIDPENGREVYLTLDGKRTYDYDVRNTVAVGNSTPFLDGYFGGNVVLGNFMLEVSFYTKFGGDYYNQTLVDRVENANPWYNVDSRALTQRWKKPGDVVFYKDIANRDLTRTSSRFIQDENRVELKSVFLSYDAPASFYSRLKVKSLRCSITMNDLAYWSTIKAERGIDYPFARNFIFSLSTRF